MNIEIDQSNHLICNYYNRQLKRLRKKLSNKDIVLHEKNEYIEEQQRTIIVLLQERNEAQSFVKKQQEIIKTLQP